MDATNPTLHYSVYKELLGAVCTQIDGGVADDVLVFSFADGRVWRMEHYQECCEHVSIEDITGDLNDLVGAPWRMAEEASDSDDDAHWTFYRFATDKGFVTVRWSGDANSYYSTAVNFGEVRL